MALKHLGWVWSGRRREGRWGGAAGVLITNGERKKKRNQARSCVVLPAEQKQPSLRLKKKNGKCSISAGKNSNRSPGLRLRGVTVGAEGGKKKKNEIMEIMIR